MDWELERDYAEARRAAGDRPSLIDPPKYPWHIVHTMASLAAVILDLERRLKLAEQKIRVGF